MISVTVYSVSDQSLALWYICLGSVDALWKVLYIHTHIIAICCLSVYFPHSKFRKYKRGKGGANSVKEERLKVGKKKKLEKNEMQMKAKGGRRDIGLQS